MGDRQSVEALQWLAYIGRTKDNLIRAGNGREVRLPEVTNLKVDGICHETNEVFEYLGCFGTGVCPACPIGTSPSAIPKKHWRTDMRKQRPGYKRSEMQVMMLFRFGGVRLENYYYKIQAEKTNSLRTPM
jgi:hypothetical protein